jgi:hypothetical protein
MKQKLWCCVGFNFKEPYYDWQSLSYKRTNSIKDHIKGSSWNWLQWKKAGWKCIRVEVEIKPLK